MLQRDRKGVSSIISTALLIAVSAGAVTSIVLMTSPIAEDLGHTRTIKTMFERMPLLGEQIKSVSELENGTSQQVGIGFRNGRLRVESASDTIEFLIDTSSEIVTPRSSRRFGDVRISSGSDVNVNTTVYNGQKAYLMENDHISYRVKRVPEKTEDLIGYYDIDEGSGQEVQGYNNSYTGILGSTDSEDENDPEWTYNCQSGSCLRFNGEDDYVFLDDIPESLNNPPYTYSAWINMETPTGENQYIISNSAQTNSVGATLSYDDASGDLLFQVRSENLGGSASTNIPSNDWVHIAGAWNGSASENSIKLFVNGELEATATPSSAGTPDAQEEGLTLGTADNSPGNYVFDGRIDEVALYNKSMDENEVVSRYQTNNFLNSFISTEDVLLSYNNTDSGAIVRDPEINAYVNGNPRSMNGFGYTTATEIGQHLPTGNVQVNMDSITGISYSLEFQLLSGSDFFSVFLDEN